MREVTFAATQMKCTENVEENIYNAERIIRHAKKEGADVILLQELFSSLYFCQEYNFDYFNLAREEKNNPLIEKMSAIAKELEVVLPISFFEKSSNAFFNSIVLIDADGVNLGKYRCDK
jgi:N-carbamoylputrescine amidase